MRDWHFLRDRPWSGASTAKKDECANHSPDVNERSICCSWTETDSLGPSHSFIPWHLQEAASIHCLSMRRWRCLWGMSVELTYDICETRTKTRIKARDTNLPSCLKIRMSVVLFIVFGPSRRGVTFLAKYRIPVLVSFKTMLLWKRKKIMKWNVEFHSVEQTAQREI